MLIEWCEQVDFADSVEVQALINIFGAKKNYAGESRHINFGQILTFLLDGYIAERVSLSPKLYATLHLARSWLLLAENKVEESIGVLLALLSKQPHNLHCRTELARIYQRQGKLAEAEVVLMELLRLEPDNLQARTELAKIYHRQGKLKNAESVLLLLLQIEKNNIRGLTEIAKVYRTQHRFQDAEISLRRVLALIPSDINAKQNSPRLIRVKTN